MTKNELSTSRLFEVIVLHSHTCRQMPPIKLQCRFAGGNNVKVKWVIWNGEQTDRWIGQGL